MFLGKTVLKWQVIYTSVLDAGIPGILDPRACVFWDVLIV